jgi:Zn-dependent oligopeptidase
MGISHYVSGASEMTEEVLRQWAADPRHAKAVDAALSVLEAGPVRDGLVQWKRFFEVNTRPPGVETYVQEVVDAELRLSDAKTANPLSYTLKGADPVPATLTKLRKMVETERDEAVRKAALKSLRGLETLVLKNGFADVVIKRNRLARQLGFDDYYEWRVRSNEQMTKAELFTVLEDLERSTRPSAHGAVQFLKKLHGGAILKPWNLTYLTQGELTHELNPYFPFSEVLHRFGRTFTAMGVDMGGASLTMDLVDRDKKYPNGFIRALIPAYSDLDGTVVPAHTQFASNADLMQVGSGQSAHRTVFHEAGHHANFAGIRTTSVAGSQEESPTSISSAETHSMFFDSVLNDAAWLALYAKDDGGNAVPWDIVKRYVIETHRMRAINLRAILMIPFFERALYEMPEHELTDANILKLARRIEKQMLFTEGSGRPMLAITHLHGSETSAYCHGYVLAQLAVYMTRAHFRDRDGFLVNNPRIGPELAEKYWKQGNAISFPDMVKQLTGKPFSAKAAIDAIEMPMEEYVRLQKAEYDGAAKLPKTPAVIALNGHFTVADGDVQIATTRDGRTFDEMADGYAAWVRRRQTVQTGAGLAP